MENEKDAAQKLLGDLQQPISGNSRLGNISDHYVTEEKLENVVDSEPDPATSLAIDTEADAKTVLAKSVKKHEDDSNSIPQQIFGFEGSTATYGNEAPNSPCGFDDHADQELGLTPGSKAAIAAQSHGAPVCASYIQEILLGEGQEPTVGNSKLLGKFLQESEFREKSQAEANNAHQKTEGRGKTLAQLHENTGSGQRRTEILHEHPIDEKLTQVHSDVNAITSISSKPMKAIDPGTKSSRRENKFSRQSNDGMESKVMKMQKAAAATTRKAPRELTGRLKMGPAASSNKPQPKTVLSPRRTMRAGISDDRHTKQAVLKSVRNYLGAKLPKMIVSEKPSVDAGHEETLRNSGSPVRYQSADVSLSATSHSLFQPENTLVTGNHSKITTEAKLLQKKEKIGLIDPTPLVWIETLVPVYYQTFEMQESTDHVTKEFDNVDEVKVSPGKHRFESDELSDDFKTPKRGPGTSQLIGDECSFSTNKETEHSGGQSPEILDFVGIETTHHPSAKTLDPPLEDAEFLEEEIPKQSATKTQASQNEKISGFSAEKNFGSLSGEVLEPIAYETLSFSGNEIPESITDGAAKSFNKEISGNTEETASGYVASIESTAGEVPLSSEKKTLASEDNETHIFQSSAFIEKKILACNVQGVSELAQDEASRSTYERVPEFRKNEAFGFSLLEEFKSEAVKNVKDEITGEAFGSLDEEIAKHGKNEALGPLMPTHIGKETSGCADENAVELHEEIIAGSQNIETQELSRNEASELRDEKDMKFVEKDLVVKEVIKPSEDEIPSKPSGDETLSFLDEQVLEDTENNAVKCEEFLENIRKKTPPRSDESAVGICSEACLTEEQTILEVQVKDESQKRKLEILHMISFPSLDAAEILVKVEPEFLNRTEQESLQKTVKRPEFSGNENKTDSELPSKTTFTNVVSTSTRMDESSGEEQVPQKTAAAESASFEESAKSEVLAGVTAKTLSPESKEFDENTGTNADKEQDLEGTAMAFTLQTIHAKQEERGPTEIAAETLSGEQVSEQQSVNSRNRNRGAGSGGDAGAFYGRQRQKKWRRGGMYSDMADACGGGGAGRNAQQEPTDSRNYMQEQGYVRFSDYQQEQGSSTIQSQYQQQTGGAGKGGESHRKRNKRNRRPRNWHQQ